MKLLELITNNRQKSKLTKSFDEHDGLLEDPAQRQMIVLPAPVHCSLQWHPEYRAFGTGRSRGLLRDALLVYARDKLA